MSSPPDIMPTTATSRSYQSNHTASTFKSSYSTTSATTYKDYPDSPRQDSHYNSPWAKQEPLPQSAHSFNAYAPPPPAIGSYNNHYDTSPIGQAVTTSSIPRGVTLTKRPQHQHHKSNPSSTDGSFSGGADFSNRSCGHSVTIWSNSTEVPTISGKSVFNRTRSTDVVDTTQHAQQAQPKPKVIPKGESKFEQRMQKRDIWAQKLLHDDQDVYRDS